MTRSRGAVTVEAVEVNPDRRWQPDRDIDAN